MDIKKFSKVGYYHNCLKEQNQDYLCSAEAKEFIAIMLADGATACKEGLKGAKLACDAVMQIVLKEWSTFFYYSEDKISYLLTEQILYWIEKNMTEKNCIQDYGSTFILAFIEKKNGRTVLINLGDGAVLSVGTDRVLYRMKPKRFRGNPCLTTTEGADKAMNVEIVNIPLGECIMLCSDGFLEQLSNLKEGNEISQLLCRFDLDGVNKKLLETDNVDDCSYIALRRERK